MQHHLQSLELVQLRHCDYREVDSKRNSNMETNKSEGLALQYNKLAMDHLHAARPAEALTLLLKADSLVRSLPVSQAQAKLRAITLNNLGCFYKRAAQPQKAMEYLEAALDLDETEETDGTNLAGTHLNICAIKSQLGDHQQAYRHAQAALTLLSSTALAHSPNLQTTLVVAHHNAGVELEYLQQTQRAVDEYREGLEVARDHLGPGHPLTVSLQKSYFQALEGMERFSLGAKSKRGKFLSATPVPPASERYQQPSRQPRRSASKDAYDYAPKASLRTSSHLSRSFDETQDKTWSDYRSSPEEEYRTRTKPGSQQRQWTLGTPLQPLQTIAPVSKSSRRDKSFSAPNKVKPPINWAPASKHSSRSTKVRRGGYKEEESQLTTVMKVLNEKLARLEEKVEGLPRKGRTLQVVKASSEEILAGNKGDVKGVILALRVYNARKEVGGIAARKKTANRISAEEKAQAAINAFEQLKRVALQEVQGLTSLPKPSFKPPPQPSRKRYFVHSKSPALAPIPEARVESKSDHRLSCLIRLQSWMRMLQARQHYLRLRLSVLTIQKWTKMVQTRRLFQAIIGAVRVVQRWWRAQKAN